MRAGGGTTCVQWRPGCSRRAGPSTTSVFCSGGFLRRVVSLVVRVLVRLRCCRRRFFGGFALSLCGGSLLPSSGKGELESAARPIQTKSREKYLFLEGQLMVLHSGLMQGTAVDKVSEPVDCSVRGFSLLSPSPTWSQPSVAQLDGECRGPAISDNRLPGVEFCCIVLVRISTTHSSSFNSSDGSGLRQ